MGLKSGASLEGDIFIVGIGGRPNTELVAGQLDTLDSAPGGVIVDGQMYGNVDIVWGQFCAYISAIPPHARRVTSATCCQLDADLMSFGLVIRCQARLHLQATCPQT